IPALDPLRSCKPEILKEIKKLSRRGGPDLSDIRNFPDPHDSDNKTTTKTTSTTAYNRNFNNIWLTMFSKQQFEEFRETDMNASKEKHIVRLAILIIEGHIDDVRCMGGDYPFRNFAPLTDGTLTNAKPDHFLSARPEQLNHQFCDELSDFVVPSTQKDHPIALNFFQEAKDPDESSAVATRQACYDDAMRA
ncbi:hypothetical protein AJ78_08782, partial [Emergomyces pasteurianus Ep9510]